jgi:hypothetical protein
MDKTLYPAFSNIPNEKDLNFKFFVDGSNPPTLAAKPLNQYIASVVRTSQGLYTITFADTGLQIASVTAELSITAPPQPYAQCGPTTGFGASFNAASPPTAVVYVLAAASGAVADPPAANANIFISGTIVLCDIAAS